MKTFLLVLHLIITISMVSVILLQRSEGGGLVSAANSFMSARGSANFLTRLTAILASAFIALSLILAIMSGSGKSKRSLFEETPASVTGAPVSSGIEGADSSETLDAHSHETSPEVPVERVPSEGTQTTTP